MAVQPIEPGTRESQLDEQPVQGLPAAANTARAKPRAARALAARISGLSPSEHALTIVVLGAATVGIDGAFLGASMAIPSPTRGEDVPWTAAVLVLEGIAVVIAALAPVRPVRTIAAMARAIAAIVETFLAMLTFLSALAVLALVGLFTVVGNDSTGSMLAVPTKDGVLHVLAIVLGMGWWGGARLLLALVLVPRKPVLAAPTIE